MVALALVVALTLAAWVPLVLMYRDAMRRSFPESHARMFVPEVLYADIPYPTLEYFNP